MNPSNPLNSVHDFLYVHVSVSADVTDVDELTSDDRSVPGIYEVELDGTVPDKWRADAALDGFHERIGIKVLDHFSIVVREGRDPESDLVPTTDDAGSYTLGRHTLMVEKLEDAPAPRRGPPVR